MAKISLIEHSDNCRAASRRKKCNLCKNKYHSDYKRKKRGELKKNKVASKYEHVFCQDCKDKNYSIKDLCKKCLTSYHYTQKKNAKQKKQEKKINDELKGICQVIQNDNLKKMNSLNRVIQTSCVELKKEN